MKVSNGSTTPREKNEKASSVMIALQKASKTWVAITLFGYVDLIVHSWCVVCLALSLLCLSVEGFDRGHDFGRGHCRDGAFHATQLAI